MKQPAVRYRLDDLVIDVGARQVVRNSTDLGITGLTFDLLLALGEAAPTLLSMEEIFARVWPKQVVSNEALTQRIKLLRQQLGDNVHQPRYVASRRGHGYRLLSPMTPLPVTDNNPGGNNKAHALYLQARTVARGTHESTEKALAMINEALSYEPEHAHALGYRSFLLAGSVGMSGRPATQLQSAEQDANLALSLHPELPDAHTALAILAAHRYRWDDAEMHFQQTLLLAPAIPFFRNLYVLNVLRPTGRLRAAHRELQIAYDLNPAEGFTAHELAMTLSLLGEDDEAMRFVELSHALSGVTVPHWDLLLVRARTHSRRGAHKEAADYAIRALPAGLRAAGAADVLTLFYCALAQETPVATALATLEKFLPNLADMTIDRRSRSFLLAACIELGGGDSVFRLIEHYQQQPEASRPSIELGDLWLPELKAFRADEQFPKLADRLNLRSHAPQ